MSGLVGLELLWRIDSYLNTNGQWVAMGTLPRFGGTRYQSTYLEHPVQGIDSAIYAAHGKTEDEARSMLRAFIVMSTYKQPGLA